MNSASTVLRGAGGTTQYGRNNVAPPGNQAANRENKPRPGAWKPPAYSTGTTYHPNEEWLMQQARNVTMWLEDEGIDARFLIHDGDKKFTLKFKEFWRDDGVRCICTPPRSPKANAFSETYIGKYKSACLNHFLCFSLNQLDYIGRKWLTYYHEQRPHQGKDIRNNILNPKFTPTSEGTIRRKESLGGILAWYEREAA